MSILIKYKLMFILSNIAKSINKPNILFVFSYQLPAIYIKKNVALLASIHKEKRSDQVVPKKKKLLSKGVLTFMKGIVILY